MRSCHGGQTAHVGGSGGDGDKTRPENAVKSRRRKKHQCVPRILRDLCYTVVKEHHRYWWLRQQRLLEITLTHIHNCKPPQQVDTPPHATKRFPLTSITSIGIKGENSFYFHVSGDHTYYYYAPKAIEIVLEIQRYVASANAVALLLDTKEAQKRVLMEELIMGTIHLPGVWQDTKNSLYPWHNRRLLRLQREISKALKNGSIAGSEKLHDLILHWKMRGENDDMDLTKLRRALDVIKEECVSDLIHKCVKPPPAPFCLAFAVCVEDVLQRTVIQPNFDKIMSTLREDTTLLGKKVLFNQKCELLRGRSADVFELPRDLRSINYKLVQRNFDALTNLQSPNDLIDQVVNIAACMYLTVYVTARFPDKNSVLPATSSRAHHVGKSAVADEHSLPLLRSKTLTEAKSAPCLDPCEPRNATLQHEEREDNKDKEMYGGLDAYSNQKEPSSESLGSTTLSSTNAPALSERHLLDDSSADAASRLRRSSSSEYREMVLPISPNESVDNNEDELNLSPLHVDLGLMARLHHGGCSMDEMFPLFVHLLCEIDVPELCIIEHFIDVLRDPDDTSERAYYFTTLAAAIKTVCEWQP
ncbi:hypothetical protein TraAM80_05459 [Trypanosoma rangeli]|uniref:VPS9 domain-containing protein n=1 Tax=Trypanosoma rangeli TaxID=5698 RepID=A0A422NEP1_TRYRA|nr:uncharacterized protein TraAM80_05459 [Trypanosoma rangeli]RNF03933.1 hypothetical protein TraAM80_05459 [Trypanosoma rangeli]|eukprot:RNF03933.1 hypothetical protein TraAM80_05459 [Trypanosoma rangeli]